jgi:hypothetical protein
MLTLRSTGLCSALVLPFLLAACGSDPATGPGTGPGGTSAAPTVTSTDPADTNQGVALNVPVAATFSTAMDPTTLTATTFTVKQGTTTVSGAVSYLGSTATFTPASNLAPGLPFTATVSTGAKDLAGNALAADFVWTFGTGTTTKLGPAAVGLGRAGSHVILAKTGISSVPASALTGDLGLSPAAATFVTGFSQVADSTNVFCRSTQVTGKVFAANYAVPTPSGLTTAVGNMESAYTDAASRPTPDHLELLSGNIGGQTLAPGLYKWTSTVTIPANVTIAGGANDVWIFQTTGDLSMSAAKNVILSGGAQAKNIFWQVAGQATFGAGSHFEGVLLSKTAITLQTGATMNGRALAQTAVALQSATIVQPAP